MTSQPLSPQSIACSLVAGLLLSFTPSDAQETKEAIQPEKPTYSAAQWLKQFDSDKDGKIAKSETSGLMERFFGRNDTNSDGFLDQKELQDLADRLAKRAPNEAKPGNQPSSDQSTKRLLESAPDDVTIEADIAYRDGDSKAWKLDLIMPKEDSDTPRPGIVFVHGGGWKNGDKRAGTFLSGAIEYARKGYVCITINYRLLGEAPFPASIEDVKCAVRWFRANAAKYNLDPDRIGGYGNSAGAHLVAMLGLAGPEAKLEGDGPYQDQSSLLQAVCASATPTDFALFGRDPGSDSKWANPNYDPAELARLSAPMTHVKAEAPPFLLFHGTADKTVNVKHSDLLVAALKDAGAKDITYLRIEGSGHGVYHQNRDETFPAMEAFFARTLGQSD